LADAGTGSQVDHRIEFRIADCELRIEQFFSFFVPIREIRGEYHFTIRRMPRRVSS